MNGLERYLAVLKGQPADVLPRIPIVMQYAAEHIGSNYAAFASDYRVLVHANAACAKDFGFDQLSCISDPYRETHGFGAAVRYVTDGPPRCEPPLQDTKDLSRLRAPDPLQSERMLDRVRAAEAYRAAFAGQYSVLGWVEGPAAEAADLRGVSTFLVDLLDDEGFACDLMDMCVEAGIAFARAQIRAGVDTVGIGDAIASQIDPRTYERLIQPREKRLIEAIRETGARVRLHICGNIAHLLPGIADLRPDILDVDYMVDMAAARAAVGRRVALAGNLDPVAAIKNGLPARIADAIRSLYERVGNSYMVSAGCEIPSGTPQANVRALCEPVLWRP
jgi:MtaA/CmuA family methyltransferase